MKPETRKYPKTPHVPWSVGTSDDKTLDNDSHFHDKWCVVSLKMDGENTSIYHNGYMHARSEEKPMHPSQSWVKKLAGDIGYLIPEDMRVCGENLYARHIIPYDELPTYFMAFSAWVKDKCLSWTDTQTFIHDLGLELVPTIYIGPYNKEGIIKAFEPYAAYHEGYVVRDIESFNYKDFDKHMMKFVNPGFRQTLKESTVHWATAKVIPNQLKTKEDGAE